jgi:transcriptional regulator GlxA family with amidase domain
VAGFSPNHFSRLFRASEKVPFEHYVRALRVERAKQMLSRTTLSVERIAQLSGFATGPYFQRVFKEVAGTTPGAFRGEARARAPVRRTRAP